MATTDDYATVDDFADDLADRHVEFSPGATDYYVEFDAREPESGELTRLRVEYRPERRFINGEEFGIGDYEPRFS